MAIPPRVQIHKMPPWRLTANDDQHVVFVANVTHSLSFTRDELQAARVNAESFSQLVDRKKAALLRSIETIVGASVADVTQEALHA